MKQRYRISPEGRPPEPTDHEIAKYRDPRKLLYNYQKAQRILHRKPLYKDPKAFLVLLLGGGGAILLAEVAETRGPPAPSPREQQVP